MRSRSIASIVVALGISCAPVAAHAQCENSVPIDQQLARRSRTVAPRAIGRVMNAAFVAAHLQLIPMRAYRGFGIALITVRADGSAPEWIHRFVVDCRTARVTQVVDAYAWANEESSRAVLPRTIDANTADAMATDVVATATGEWPSAMSIMPFDGGFDVDASLGGDEMSAPREVVHLRVTREGRVRVR